MPVPCVGLEDLEYLICFPHRTLQSLGGGGGGGEREREREKIILYYTRIKI